MKRYLPLIAGCCLLFSCQKESFTDTEDPDYALMAVSVSTKTAKNYNNFFTRYGNGWTGSDATYSIPLPDGRIVWMFGDTFLDTVYADRSRPVSPLIRNTFMVQTATNYNAFTTLVSGTIDDPQALVDTPDPATEWYWPGDGTATGDNLYVYMMKFHATGAGGGFGFAYESTDLVKFSLPSITEVSRTTVWDDDPDLLFGAAVMEVGDYLYLYGPESAGILKYVQASRVPLSNLYAPLEYYNAVTDTWQSTFPGPSGRLAKISGGNVDVSAQFSVFYNAGKYRLVTQEGLLGRDIFTWESSSPVGPWKTKKKFYTTPDDPDKVYTYNAFVHPEITNADGYILMSYNLNAISFGDLFTNADTYRPKFIWMKYL